MAITDQAEAEKIAALKVRKFELQNLVTSIQAQLGEKRLYDGSRMLDEIEFHQRRSGWQRQLVKANDELRKVKLEIEIISDRLHVARNHGNIGVNLLLKEVLRARDDLRKTADDVKCTEAVRHVSRLAAQAIDDAIERARKAEAAPKVGR